MTTKQLETALAYTDSPRIILRDGTTYPCERTDGPVVDTAIKDGILAMATEADRVIFAAAEDIVAVRTTASKRIYRDWFGDGE